MCRKSQLQGWCVICFGLGIAVGCRLESWLLCCLGGTGLIFLGLMLLRRR